MISKYFTSLREVAEHFPASGEFREEEFHKQNSGAGELSYLVGILDNNPSNSALQGRK